MLGEKAQQVRGDDEAAGNEQDRPRAEAALEKPALALPGTDRARKAVVPQLSSSGLPSSQHHAGHDGGDKEPAEGLDGDADAMVQTVRREGPNSTSRQLGAFPSECFG